jgi:protein-tyrosine phosphatase
LNVVPQVLLVCTANICRSPMAEVLWREAAAGRRRPLTVGSAGVEAEPGRAADGTAVELMALRGLDLSEHRAERFRADLALESELILVMERDHQRRIQALAPALAGRVQLLGRWTIGEIGDPFRQEQNIYVECIELLENSVKSWLNRLP